MTDKLERLARIEEEAAALRKLIEAEQVKTPCFAPKHGETYWQLICGADEKHFHATRFNVSPPKAAFRDQATADAYAEAFNVMIELRLYADGGKYFIVVDDSDDVRPWDDAYTYHSDHAFSGRYSSRDQAQKAIMNVGDERIYRAIKTLCGVL